VAVDKVARDRIAALTLEVTALEADVATLAAFIAPLRTGVTLTPSAWEALTMGTTRTPPVGLFHLMTDDVVFVPAPPPSPPALPVLSVTPASLLFDPTEVGTTQDKPFTVQNTGFGTLAGTASATGVFSLVGGSVFNLGTGQVQVVTVRFAPTSVATFTSTVTFASNGGNDALSVQGDGVGSPPPPPAPPVLSVTPSSLLFDSTLVGATQDKSFTVQNAGAGTLTGTATVPAGVFSVIAGGTFSLGAGLTQVTTIRFTPTSAATFAATVTFASNVGTAARPVQGDGVAPPPPPPTPLTVTVEQAVGQADPTMTAPIHFTVVFSAVVTDFVAGDVLVTGSAGGTKTVLATGAGTTYDVAISGMTTAGSVVASVPFWSAHDAVGTGNNASTSVDNVVSWQVPVTPPAIPDLALWESHMVTQGQVYLDYVAARASHSFDENLAYIYYDGPRVMAQIHAYTNEARWLVGVDDTLDIWLNTYILPNNGAVPGYWNFTTGLLQHYQRTGNTVSKNALIAMSTNAMYAQDFADTCVDQALSRECAYAMLAMQNAEAVGEAHRARRDTLRNSAYGHIPQWLANPPTGQLSPFMMGLTAHSLIRDWEVTADSRCLPAIVSLADWLWANAWDPVSRSMWYDLNQVPRQPTPDLNLLIAPLYAWIYQQTGSTIARDRGDAIWTGGVELAWLSGGKQFAQNYWWSFDYVTWRS
jgi:hypothetical protein